MLSRFSSLRFVAANVSKLAATRRTTTPAASNLPLHTSAASLAERPTERKKPVTAEFDKIKIADIMEADYNPNHPERNVAVALAGCGDRDGTFPLEAMSLAINLQRHNFTAHFYAGNYSMTPIDHITGEPFPLKKIQEADRSAWDDAAHLIDEKSIYNLRELSKRENCDQYCGLFIPGGQGIGHEEFKRHVKKAIYRYKAAHKPIATISDACQLVAECFRGVRVTIGTTPRAKSDPNSKTHLAQYLEQTAGSIVDSATSLEVVHCDKYNVFSTPGHYGCGATLWDIHRGIERLVKAVKADLDEDDTPAGW